MGKFFGTDGVRGVANAELTPELAYRIGKASAYVLSKANDRPLFLIGKDTRISGDMLENALVAGILSVGGNVVLLGVIPTPAVAYLVQEYKADAGVVISASHNPFEYNGIKLFNGKGFKLDDEVEYEIEKYIEEGVDASKCVGDKIGKVIPAEGAFDKYVEFLKAAYDRTLDGMKIVLDTSNGASYKVAPAVYKALGADVTVIADEPDGININNACGSTHPEKLQEKVKEVGADIGFAYDGDADRLIVVDDLGRILDGDRAMCICAEHLKSQGELGENKLTVTVMSNIGLHKYLEDKGIDVEVTKVGDRYVIESMLETGSTLGGEQSGHMIFLNNTTTGDGVMSSLQFMKALVASGKKASELSDNIKIYPQALVNAKVSNDKKTAALEDEEIKAAISKVEEKVKGNGRVLIRPSGTEPLVRVMLEGENLDEIKKYAEELAAMYESKYGVGK